MDSSCGHARAPLLEVGLGLGGRRTARCCPVCPLAPQLQAATGVPPGRQRLFRRSGRLVLAPRLAGGLGAADPKSYIAPIIFTVLFVLAAAAGIALMIVWGVLKDETFTTIWWVGAGLVIGAACLLLITIPCWIYACCCDA